MKRLLPFIFLLLSLFTSFGWWREYNAHQQDMASVTEDLGKAVKNQLRQRDETYERIQKYIDDRVLLSGPPDYADCRDTLERLRRETAARLRMTDTAGWKSFQQKLRILDQEQQLCEAIQSDVYEWSCCMTDEASGEIQVQVDDSQGYTVPEGDYVKARIFLKVNPPETYRMRSSRGEILREICGGDSYLLIPTQGVLAAGEREKRLHCSVETDMPLRTGGVFHTVSELSFTVVKK